MTTSPENPYILNELALEHNLPISDSFDQLLEYSNTDQKSLHSARTGDVRVFSASLAKLKIDTMIFLRIASTAAQKAIMELAVTKAGYSDKEGPTTDLSKYIIEIILNRALSAVNVDMFSSALGFGHGHQYLRHSKNIAKVI